MKEMKVACKRIGKACHLRSVFTLHEIATEGFLRGNKGIFQLLEREEKGSSPEIRRRPIVPPIRTATSFFEKLGLPLYVRWLILWEIKTDTEKLCIFLAVLGWTCSNSSLLPRDLSAFVAPLVGGGNFLIVSANGIKGVVGNSVCQD